MTRHLGHFLSTLPLYPFRYTAWLGCFLGPAGFKHCVEKLQEKLQEFSHSHNREPNPQTQLAANIGHKILNLLKGKYSYQIEYQWGIQTSR